MQVAAIPTRLAGWQRAPQLARHHQEQAGVSQSALVRNLNVPTALVSQWERGERRPTGAAVKCCPW